MTKQNKNYDLSHFISLREIWRSQRIYDFYCSELSLVIEVDGTTHLEDKDVLYDQKRTVILAKHGLKILRYWNDDILNGAHIVGEIIDNEINKITHPSPPLSGRG